MQIKNRKIFQSDLVLNLSFVLLLILILVTRSIIFFKVNLVQIDSDQPFMWMGAADYAKGIFYEPRFYGQNYNSFLEALFAVPFIWLNIPVYVALPIATHLLFLFPVLFSAFYLYAKNKKENAVLLLTIFLCLPVGYDILSSIPRGFVTGLFFTVFFIGSFLHPRLMRWVIVNTSMALLGYFINPNSLVVIFPLMLYLFLNNYNNKRFYLSIFCCMLLYYPLYLLFDKYYVAHPEHVIYGLDYHYSIEYFLENIRHLDQVFVHITPFIEGKSVFFLMLLLIIFIYLYRQNKKGFYAFLGLTAILIFSFFTSKSRDGSEWPFYSFSRMFLGIPLCIGLFLATVKIPRTFVYVFILPLVFIYTAFKLINIQEKINWHLSESHWLGVHLVSLPSVLEAQNFYKEVCKKENVEHLLISTDFWLSTYLAYGGPALDSDFPNTMELVNERRYWIRESKQQTILTDFVLISVSNQLHKKIKSSDFEIKALDDYGLYRIRINKLRTDSMIRTILDSEKGNF